MENSSLVERRKMSILNHFNYTRFRKTGNNQNISYILVGHRNWVIGIACALVVILTGIDSATVFGQDEAYPVPDNNQWAVNEAIRLNLAYPVATDQIEPTISLGDSGQSGNSVDLTTANQNTLPAGSGGGDRPFLPVGWGRVSSGREHGNGGCSSVDNTNNVINRKWDASSFSFGNTLSTGIWPASGGSSPLFLYANGTIAQYPPNLDTTLTCIWSGYDLWSDDINYNGTGNNFSATIRFEFDLILNVGSDDRLEMVASLRKSDGTWVDQTSQIFDSSHPESSSALRTFHVQTDEITVNHNDVDGGHWDRARITFRFVSDESDEATIGAFLSNIRLWGQRGTEPRSSCDELDSSPDSQASRVGINIGYRVPGIELPYIRPDDLTTLYDLQKLGIGWVRFVIVPEFDANNEPYIDYESYRFMINNLCDRGISVILIIGIETVEGTNLGRRFPEVTDEQEIYQGILGNPNFISAFRAQADELSTEFPDVLHWEILNEPDLIQFFLDENVLYADILSSANDAIKSNNPSSTVIMGGVSSTWFGQIALGKGYSFLDNVYTNANPIFSNGFDDLGIHPYTDEGVYRGLSPNDYFFDVDKEISQNGSVTIFDPIRDLMIDVDTNGAKPIQITEIGFNTGLASDGSFEPPDIERGIAGVTPGEVANASLATEAQQATYLNEAYSILFGESANASSSLAINDVDKVIWYRYDDIF